MTMPAIAPPLSPLSSSSDSDAWPAPTAVEEDEENDDGAVALTAVLLGCTTGALVDGAAVTAVDEEEDAADGAAVGALVGCTTGTTLVAAVEAVGDDAAADKDDEREPAIADDAEAMAGEDEDRVELLDEEDDGEEDEKDEEVEEEDEDVEGGTAAHSRLVYTTKMYVQFDTTTESIAAAAAFDMH